MMSSRVTRSSSRSSAAAAESRGLYATTSVGFGSHSLSAMAPTSTSPAGSRGLSAATPKLVRSAGSQGLSAVTPVLPLLASRSGPFATPPSSRSRGPPATVAPVGAGSVPDISFSSSFVAGESLFDPRPSSSLSSTVGSPETTSTSPFGQQFEQNSHSVSPFDLTGNDDPLDHSTSAVDITTKELESFGLQRRESNDILMSTKTGCWESFEGSNFMSYEEPTGAKEFFYVRPCYQDIFQILHESWQGRKPRSQTPQRCALLTGTPGIGKSVFGKMLCFILSKRPKPALIFYQQFDSSSIVAFWQGGFFKFADRDQAEDLIDNLCSLGVYSKSDSDNDLIEIWSIADSCIPISHPSINKICVTSPGDTRVGDFARKVKHWVKGNLALTLAIPPCTWEEIQAIRLALFGESAEETCPLDTLQRRYDLWGGVPRTLFWTAPSFSAEEEFRNLKMADAMSRLATFDLDHERHSGRLFHLYPSFGHMEDREHMSLMDRYHTKHAKFYWASQELEMKAWGQFRHQQEADVIDFISTLSNDPGSRGKAWEAHIHHLIQTCGVRGTLKNLGTDSTTKNFTLHCPKASFFQTFEQIDGSAQYWQPVSKRHATCDAYIPNDGIMLQMTIGEQHTINMNGLEASLKSTIFKQWENDHPDKLKFIFIVDTTVYEEYIGDQSFRYTKTSNKADSERKKKARKESVECRVEQYVLMVDLEPRLKELRYGAGRKRGRVDEGDEMRLIKRRVKKSKVSVI